MTASEERRLGAGGELRGAVGPGGGGQRRGDGRGPVDQPRGGRGRAGWALPGPADSGLGAGGGLGGGGRREGSWTSPRGAGASGPWGLCRALTGQRARSCAPGRAGSGRGQGRGPGRGRPRREPHRGRAPATHPTATRFRLRRASQGLTGSRGRAGGGGPSSPPAWPEALRHPVAMGTRPPPGCCVRAASPAGTAVAWGPTAVLTSGAPSGSDGKLMACSNENDSWAFTHKGAG